MATKKTIKRIILSGGKKTVDDTPNQKLEASPKAARQTTASSFNLLAVIGAPGRYFKNSWNELRQVRWPNRSATWSLTLAVILFTAFFAVIILVLDAGFQYLFKEVILK